MLVQKFDFVGDEIRLDQLEGFLVEVWHFLLNVVEQESLDQVVSVHFDWDFLKETFNLQTLLVDLLLAQIHAFLGVDQVERQNGLVVDSESFDWI